MADYHCKCGQTNPLEFYKYRTYQCVKCVRAERTNPQFRKPPSCKCGETDPTKFTKRQNHVCKVCISVRASATYVKDMADDSKRLAKIAYTRAHQQANLIKYRFNSAKTRANKAGIPFNITPDYLQELSDLQNGRCYYSGIPFDTTTKHYNMSLERIDSSKGYTKGNVVWTVNIVNTMKNDLSMEEFLDVAKKLVEYQASVD